MPTGAHLLSMAGIGSEARAYMGGTTSGRIAVYAAQVYFRRGAYNARIDIIDLGSLRTGGVLALARILDGRMMRAR